MAITAACTPPADTKEKKTNGKETIVDGNKTIKKFYNADGSLRKEIHYEHGVQKGVSKEYYNDGKVYQEVNYENNLREGVARRYFETGVLSQETPYVKDKIHGIQKKYRRSGELMAEIPYQDDHLCMGLKEYSTDGKPKVQYPRIVITPIDNTLRNDTYILRLSLSDNSKGGVEYFLGDLAKAKYIEDYTEKIIVKNGVGEIKYPVPPGTFLMQQINVIAKIKTSQGNYYITQRAYNLSIENR
jgi:hypothetical protein